MSKSKIITIIVVLVTVAAGAYLLWSRGGLKSFPPKADPPMAENPSKNFNEFQEYSSPDYGFSFKYSKGFNVSELDDDSGHTVLVQSYEVEPRKGFQVYITPFDEPEPLTAARILQDLPSSEVIDPKDVLIGEGKAISAVIFLSTSPSFGKTREVWFVFAENLYQVTTYEGQDNLIGPILDTLKFN